MKLMVSNELEFDFKNINNHTCICSPGVMPPDEDKASINNSVYTNVMAAYAIFFAK